MIGAWLFRFTNLFGYVVEVIGYGQTVEEAENNAIKKWPHPVEKVERVKFLWDRDDLWLMDDITEIGIM